ncbi:PH domain-containing protein [Actinocorallia sp. B10E7]|uniref:PH domain-containing protein n=1 Tax=Actinocorallia sp. B10E7 TaxID=3153558 RepID=UPI00325CD92B
MRFNQVMVVRDRARARVFRKYLMENEGNVIAVRRHPAVLLRYFCEVLGGLVAAGALTGWLGGGAAVVVIWIAWLALVGRLLWKLLTWLVEFFIVTDLRLMYIRGLIARRVGMIPRGKVTDIRMERTVMGEILDYGTFIMESAGDDQAFRTVTFMPYPEQLYYEVSSALFSSEGVDD